MRKVLKVIAILVALIIVAVAGLTAYVKLALPNTGPAPALTVASTAEKIERGRYLANHVMVCMDCHSQRNWAEFSGPPKEGTLGMGGDRFDQSVGMPGVFYSRNITPAGLSSWTDGEIFHAITTGVSKDGHALFPLMPHPSYGTLDKEDIECVIAYIRTIPAIQNTVPASEPDFPFSIILNTIPKKATFHTRPPVTDSIAYGRYLITASGCGECHTPVKNGQPILEQAFHGGRGFETPDGTLYSSNLTPDATGIGSLSKTAFIARFKQYADSSMKHIPVAQGEFNTIMPWTMYADMKEEDLGAIYSYLRSLKPVENQVTKFVPKGMEKK